VLAFAPVGFYPLLFLTLALLVHLWGPASPRQCFFLGFWFGLGFFGAGVSWIYVSLSEFGGMQPVLAAVATLLFCAFIALFPAGAGWLQARIPASAVVRAVPLIPAAWTLAEWVRGTIFTGFPWLAAGYASIGGPLQGYAPLGGIFAVSFLTAAGAGLVWCIARGERRHAAAAALVAILVAGEALRHVAWTEPQGEPLEAALLQGNVRQELKFRPERYAQIVETYARLAESTKARLIVLPETALPRYFDMIDPRVLGRLDAAARRNGGDLLLGLPFRTSARDYYNSVLSLGASPPQIYHKTHLVPFGEFVPPLFGWINNFIAMPLGDFARGGPAQPPLAVAGQRVAVNICYEDAFGDEIGSRAAPATLLVNVSNVAWFGDSLAPAQHLQMARARAIETGRMHLAATNTGITAAIDRDGRVLGRLPSFAEGLLEVKAQGYSGATPYVRFADWPILALCLALLAAWTIVGRIKRR
jgi:apolipoprotein N-acyltransferase